ncbi:MAG: universal stress protein [Methanosarcinales archaeon]|jgi:nucleotide-binding universal stress UspA family protein|nr:universal stress protein [Methanosarcinales archaeon]
MTGNLYNTIVVGTDGTEYAKKAINAAVGLAKLTGAKLYAVYVSDVSNITPTSVEWELIAVNLKVEAEAAFGFVRERAGAEGVNFETVNLSGAAAHEIVQYANRVNADLIVVGAAGKKAIERLILGSVSEKIIRSAKQQVLVVRSDAAESGK